MMAGNMMTIRMKAFGKDTNGRSTWAEVDIPLRQVTPLHAETARQEGTYWGISLNQMVEPVGGGQDEMHLTNVPRLVWGMSGHHEHRLQSGEVRRSAMGEGVFVQGTSLHHASFARSREPVITLSLTLPGTDLYDFKV
jgi:hypothetical protein